MTRTALIFNYNDYETISLIKEFFDGTQKMIKNDANLMKETLKGLKFDVHETSVKEMSEIKAQLIEKMKEECEIFTVVLLVQGFKNQDEYDSMIEDIVDCLKELKCYKLIFTQLYIEDKIVYLVTVDRSTIEPLVNKKVLSFGQSHSNCFIVRSIRETEEYQESSLFFSLLAEELKEHEGRNIYQIIESVFQKKKERIDEHEKEPSCSLISTMPELFKF